MKTERELYEELQNKSVLKRLVFIDSLNMYLTKDEYSDDDLTIQYCLEINHGWKMWQASASRDGYKLVPVDKLDSELKKEQDKVKTLLKRIDLSLTALYVVDRRSYEVNKAIMHLRGQLD